MSDPKVKPSIAASSLAEKLATHTDGSVEEFFTRRMLIGEAAALIQSALGDLLEKAERREWLLRRIMEDLPSKRDWLDPALEREAMDSTLAANIAPWKTTI